MRTSIKYPNLKRKGLRYGIFVLVMCLTSALSFHALATDPPPWDINNPAGDKDLPKWCPPSTHPGLAVICGTVVTSNVVNVPGDVEMPFVPIDGVLVAAYEDNPITSTGAVSGELSNVFSSSVTNEEGRYRIMVRRVAPNLRVHLVFLCGSTKVHEQPVQTWHNTWQLVSQIDCAPDIQNRGLEQQTATLLPDSKGNITKVFGLTEETFDPYATPPFPLKDATDTSSFLGCTNKPFKDRPIGLQKKFQPVINVIVNEDNFDHRFTLNPITFEGVSIPLFNQIEGTFTSPGGLWEPDCLLRNERGTYMCNTLTCGKWEFDGIPQPCSGNADGCSQVGSWLTDGYTAAKLYAKTDCTVDPNGIGSDGTLSADASAAQADCLAKLQAEAAAFHQAVLDGANLNDPKFSDKIDGVMCNVRPSEPMEDEDYLTRPFYKFIPESPGEYEEPFRRFEYRNNLKEVVADPYTPMQFTNTYIGSSANTGTGLPTATYWRSFMGAESTTPNLPNCDALALRNYPMQDKDKPVIQNALINAGYMTDLAEPYGALEDIYYSGQRDLSENVCQLNSGDLVKLCEIQVPWGAGALCNVYSDECKDPDLRPGLTGSLNRLASPTSLITDPNDQEVIRTNIQNTLTQCTGKFKLNKLYFAEDLIFKVGNTQFGMHSDTQNDSIPDACEREIEFGSADTEQNCLPLTGSRVALQDGGNFHANSFNTMWCAMFPQYCSNRVETAGTGPLRKAVNALDLPTWSEDEFKTRYLDETTWTVDHVGANNIATCSISNIYQVDITGPTQEIAGNLSADPEKGGMFDNLFTGNIQHKGNISAGTSNWYMSHKAILRDRIMKTGGGGLFDGLYIGKIGVGTSNGIADLAFSSLFGRDIWDSMLTLAGGDAKLHNLTFHLPDLVGAILGSLSGEIDWKSYGDRDAGMSGITPLEKPYYTVIMDYPITDEGFKESFVLPGEVIGSDGKWTGEMVKPELVPEEWGPGHECYNFDTTIIGGKFCGTTREPPYGISRTCRLDKCVNFKRVETAQCSCKIRLDPLTHEPVPNGNVRCNIIESSREVRNLIVEDCSWENRLTCARLQETSRPWQSWPEGYGDARCVRYNDRDECVETTPYYRDQRGGGESTGVVYPPDDIDLEIESEDHGSCYTNPANGEDVCFGEDGTPYKPDHIDEDETCFDKFPEHWNDPNERSYSYTIEGNPGLDRPRCWSSVAGPFRKEPNFSAAGLETPAPGHGATINNCNGYIRVEDSALRASQYPPFERDGQKQTNLDKASEVGIKIQRTFAAPWQPFWGGETKWWANSQETNDPGLDDGLTADFYTKRQLFSSPGVGDRATVRAHMAYPIIVPVSTQGRKLRQVQFHCNMLGSYSPDEENPIQKEFSNELTSFDPDLDDVGGWYCQVLDIPSVQIPELEAPGGSCQISRYGTCTDLIKQMWMLDAGTDQTITEEERQIILADLQTFDFPYYFRATLDWAAFESNTPAAALLTAMYLEGGLNYRYYKEWGDNATAFNYGIPWWGQMKLGSNSTCNNLVWTAQGPYKILQSAMVRLLEHPSIGPKLGAAINRAGSGRVNTLRAAGRCNFLDASVIAGFLLNPQAGSHRGQCGDFSISDALQTYGAGAYTTEGVNMASALQLYTTCR